MRLVHHSRRAWLAAGSTALALCVLAGCADLPVVQRANAVPAQGQGGNISAQARAELAPTGTLRVGVYRGSPTSLVDGRDGQPAGIAHDVGKLLGKELGLPVRVVEFPRVALVLDALKAGQVDLTFTNATESRARDMDFTAALVRLELGYLVPSTSTMKTTGDVDHAGVRVGVSEGSTSQATLGRVLRQATVVPVANLDLARAMLTRGELSAFATNKGILNEMADRVAGARVLDGRWGEERLAIAVPKARPAAGEYLQRFARQIKADGRLQAMVTRSGLRGVAQD